jgi:hypothetical protein
MSKPDGGPAFPTRAIAYLTAGDDGSTSPVFSDLSGMSLRDYFACHVQPREETDDISRCDDQDLLEKYGTPEEIDEGFRLVLPEQSMYLRNITLRAALESRARAHLRYLEADAMLAERSK